MGKVRANTRRHLHRAKQQAAKERKLAPDASFMYRHTAEMRKMLKGVDLDRYESLAGS